MNLLLLDNQEEIQTILQHLVLKMEEFIEDDLLQVHIIRENHKHKQQQQHHHNVQVV
jgi:uncharacterized protein YecA (UPF0149 family)